MADRSHDVPWEGPKPAAASKIARRDLQQPLDRSPVSIAEFGKDS
jgi:hypothetical protein